MLTQIQHREVLFPTSHESMMKAEAMIDQIAEDAQLADELRGNIHVAVFEAIRNAMDFGNNKDEKKKVKVTVEGKDNEIVFTIKDEGTGFDFNNIPDPTAPENREKITGRGIFLMKNLADKVEFLDNGSKVKIHFKV